MDETEIAARETNVLKSLKKPKFMDFKNIVSWNLLVIYGCGYMIHPFKNKMDYIRFIPKLGYLLGIFILQLTSELINFHYLEGTVTEIVSASFLTLTHAVQLVKVLFMYKYMRDIEVLIESINRPEFQPKSDYQRKILRSYIRAAKWILGGFWSACTLTCWSWALYPILEEELRLPLAGWFPFDLSNNINFAIAYIFVIIGAWFNGICNIAIDALLSALIMVVAAELTILNDSLKNIRNFSEAELGVTFKNVGDKNEVCPELQKIMNKKLIDCIVHHRNILRFNDEYQNVFSYVVLAQFVGSVVLICITMFEMALAPVGSIHFFSMSGYQCCMLLEVYLVCYYGNEVMLQSTQLTYSAYQCSWENASEEFKKNLLYFMTRSQVDIKILAGSIFTLNLPCFVTILKSSWSYFAVLRSINN